MASHSSLKSLPRHISELDGMRGCAALGIVVTHVSFQTGTGWGIAERFDYFVSVFFALSAFLLWRRRALHSPRDYAWSRVGRLALAYLVCVVLVFALLPDAHSATATQLFSNLTGTQIYVVDGLAPGLTQLWSLCVEFAFYLVLPLLAAVMRGWSRRRRVWAIAVAAVLSWGWGFVPFVADYAKGDVNSQIWPPAYASWFAVGMLLAEAETVRGQFPGWLKRALRMRWAWWLVACGCLWLASREWFGPRGLAHPEPGEFARRIMVGAVFAVCVMAPVALAPRKSSLLSSQWGQALGRWSYSLFLWHVAVLSVVFPLLGVPLFSGKVVDFCVAFAVTVAGSLLVSAVSYAVVEEPGRRLVGQFARRLGHRTQASEAAHKQVTRTESPA
ncbi:acyltransferase [Corynebacterium sp. HMSC076D02]|uniref:acyltransferase family protein n=1 Tax=Corynebacterium sp. HMSC076D02 TaxID=1739439 RepID=UPI0027380C09|nr:acyltransferase [Corynebacterium sp. HMSC076D02]